MSFNKSSIRESPEKKQDSDHSLGSEVSDRQLNFSLWFIRHQARLWMGVLVILLVVGASTLGYSLFKFGHYLIFGLGEDQRLQFELSSSPNPSFDRQNFFDNFYYSPVTVIAFDSEKSDLVASVGNENSRSVARFNYRFEYNGERLDGGESFVLPGETKYLISLAQPLSSLAGVELIIEDLRFQNLSPRLIPDWQQYRLDRLDFLIEKPTFVPGSTNPLSERVNLSEVRFNISNQTAYGYRNVPLLIVLKRQGETVGVNRHYLSDFYSGQSRAVTLVWPGRLTAVDQIEVLPDLDIFDENVYLRYFAR